MHLTCYLYNLKKRAFNFIIKLYNFFKSKLFNIKKRLFNFKSKYLLAYYLFVFELNFLINKIIKLIFFAYFIYVFLVLSFLFVYFLITVFLPIAQAYCGLKFIEICYPLFVFFSFIDSSLSLNIIQEIPSCYFENLIYYINYNLNLLYYYNFGFIIQDSNYILSFEGQVSKAILFNLEIDLDLLTNINNRAASYTTNPNETHSAVLQFKEAAQEGFSGVAFDTVQLICAQPSVEFLNSEKDRFIGMVNSENTNEGEKLFAACAQMAIDQALQFKEPNKYDITPDTIAHIEHGFPDGSNH